MHLHPASLKHTWVSQHIPIREASSKKIILVLIATPQLCPNSMEYTCSLDPEGINSFNQHFPLCDSVLEQIHMCLPPLHFFLVIYKKCIHRIITESMNGLGWKGP